MRHGTIITTALLGAMTLSACNSPMDRSMESELHQRLLATNARYTERIADAKPVQVSRPVSTVEQKLTTEQRNELDNMSGPTAYISAQADYGPDLFDTTNTPTVSMNLQRVIQSTVENNLTLQIARLVPSVDDALITQAQAVFDATFYATVDYQKVDNAQPPTSSLALSPNQTTTTSTTLGIRKTLTTGGTVAIQQEIVSNYRSSTLYNTDNWYTSGLLLNIQQPLLRNFGTDVNMAQIELNVSSRKQSIEDLRSQLLAAVHNAESAYWALVLARQNLLIQERLLERTIKDRDQIEKRSVLDASPATITEANSFVEERRADVIRAQNTVRAASDALKQLVNDPNLPVSDETLIVPLDTPVDAPMQVSLLDAISIALQNRPELRKALLEIDDAAVRQRVADNQRLPVLNLSASVRFNGVGESMPDTLDSAGEAKLIDYLISGQFEAPLGNRAAEALYEQRKIERRASVINYQNQAQSVVLEIKNAQRDLITAYRVIGAEQASRRAAAENLRALEAQEEAGAALSPEFLDLKLRRQEALANAEAREIQAVVDYNIAISAYYQAMGTLLERNGINFNDASGQ
ncbi:MAG: TolC family protein [Phycisphaeraceae bacterium JB051]